jgi:hypothetical protein
MSKLHQSGQESASLQFYDRFANLDNLENIEYCSLPCIHCSERQHASSMVTIDKGAESKHEQQGREATMKEKKIK